MLLDCTGTQHQEWTKATYTFLIPELLFSHAQGSGWERDWGREGGQAALSYSLPCIIVSVLEAQLNFFLLAPSPDTPSELVTPFILTSSASVDNLDSLTAEQSAYVALEQSRLY